MVVSEGEEADDDDEVQTGRTRRPERSRSIFFFFCSSHVGVHGFP